MADTKKLYCDTLLRLCETQPLNRITVTAVIKETHTARQTFYNNFRDMNDLVSYIPISHLVQSGLPINTVENIRHAFAFAQHHKGFFRQLPDHAGQNNFRDTILEWLQQASYEQHLSPSLSPDEKLLLKLKIDVYLCGIVDVFLQWCRCDLQWSFEVVLDAIWQCAPDFLRKEPLQATLE